MEWFEEEGSTLFSIPTRRVGKILKRFFEGAVGSAKGFLEDG